jgi:hypothetical protein
VPVGRGAGHAGPRAGYGLPPGQLVERIAATGAVGGNLEDGPPPATLAALGVARISYGAGLHRAGRAPPGRAARPHRLRLNGPVAAHLFTGEPPAEPLEAARTVEAPRAAA